MKEHISYRLLFKTLYTNLKIITNMMATCQHYENQVVQAAKPYSLDANLHREKAQTYADMRFLLHSVIREYEEYAEPEMSFANWRQPEQDDEEEADT